MRKTANDLAKLKGGKIYQCFINASKGENYEMNLFQKAQIKSYDEDVQNQEKYNIQQINMNNTQGNSNYYQTQQMNNQNLNIYDRNENLKYEDDYIYNINCSQINMIRNNLNSNLYKPNKIYKNNVLQIPVNFHKNYALEGEKPKLNNFLGK